MRRTLTVGLGGLLLVMLTGCFKVDMALTVTEDDTVDGTMIVAIEESLADVADESEDEGFMAGDLPEGAVVEEYAEDGFVGEKATFSAVPLSEFVEFSETDEAEGDDFSLTRDGDDFVFDASFDTDEMMGDTGASPESATDDEFSQGIEEMVNRALAEAEFVVAITFPGEIRETNGEVEGTTVTWDLDITEESQMHAVAAAESGGVLGGSGFPVLPVAIGGVLLLGLLGVGGWLLSRRRAG